MLSLFNLTLFCAAFAGMFQGVAAMMRAYYWGTAALIRAKRGAPELPSIGAQGSATKRQR